MNFIENAGKCFTFISQLEERHKENYSYNMQAYESLLTNIEPIVADDISSFIQEVQRVLQEDDVRLYLWHLSYTITDFKKPLVAIRRFNEDNKKIMNISDEELSAIFKGGKFEST